MIGTLWAYSNDNAMAADPYVVGIVGKANQMNAQTGDPRMITQSQSPAPPVFAPQTWFGDLKLAIFRVLPTSVIGRPSGPPKRNTGVIRGRRVALTGPTTVERAVQRGPSQVSTVRPLWESYLYGSDPYLAS